jgi:SAM-dependent methyltransferase
MASQPDRGDASAGPLQEEDISAFLAGRSLYGDDFDLDHIRQWYDDEKEGYADLGAKDRPHYSYSYHECNRWYGFRHLPKRRWRHVLGVGSAYGDEFLPIIDSIDRLTIVEPSDQFVGDQVHGVPATYAKPEVSGNLLFDDGTFDLVVCLRSLHHVPNVSHVVSEMCRCLTPGGCAVLCEPIVSMGDWRKPRGKLTRHERGIPLRLFVEALTRAGFRIERQNLCNHSVVRLFWSSVLHRAPYNCHSAVLLDDLLSRLTGFHLTYHRTRVAQKLKPSSVFLVASKPATGPSRGCEQGGGQDRAATAQ